MITLLAIFNMGLLLQLKLLRGKITPKEHISTVTIMLKNTTIIVFDIEFGHFLFEGLILFSLISMQQKSRYEFKV